jgi:excisionase family DNA binding protein
MWHDDRSAAKYLSQKANRGVSWRTVQRWRLAGLITYRRIGKQVRMTESDLDAFLERDVVRAKTPA